MRTLDIEIKQSSAILHGYLNNDLQGFEKQKSILILPGGGYTSCSPSEGEPIALAYYEKGFQAFVLCYRTENPFCWEHTWKDANDALQMLHEKHEEWNIDIAEITIIGFSAGGHLAGALAVAGKVRPASAILCYPLVIRSLATLLSPQLPAIDEAVDKLTPPIFICTTYEDHVVPVRNTIRLIQALNEYKVPFECHIYTWGHHGMSLGTIQTAAGKQENVDERYASWFELSISWLSKLYSNKHTLFHKQWEEHSLGYAMQHPRQKACLEAEFPILKNKEILEAVSHLTISEFMTKVKGM